MDSTQLAVAIHAYQDRRAYAVRVFRNGCLVGSDTGDGNRALHFETWEITSSILGLLVARQVQLGLLSLDDPIGSLVARADAAHGAITIRDLLTRSSGITRERENSFATYRADWALTKPVARQPGSVFGDAPLARALLVEALQQAGGVDVELFAQRELFVPLGIAGHDWSRDSNGSPNDSFGLRLTADDLARLAELVRRRGAWQGRQLLSPSYVAEMLRPSARNPCFGLLTWLNAAPGCNGTPQHLLPMLPADLWTWRGHDDQRAVVIPSLGLVVVRYGINGGDARSTDDQQTWERGVLLSLLKAVRDVKPSRTPGDGPIPITDEPFADDPTARFRSRPVPGAPGPRRARAPQLTIARETAGQRKLVGVRIACPPGPDDRRCSGIAELRGLQAEPRRWSVAPGQSREVLLRLRQRPPGDRDAIVEVRADDHAGGVTVRLALAVKR